MYCTDILPPLYGFFTTEVPPLLYYSHIPVFFTSLLVGFYLLYKNHRDLATRVLFIVISLFSALVVLSLVLWTNANVKYVIFAWMLSQIIYTLIPIAALRLFYVFTRKKDVPGLYKAVWLVIFLGISLLSFSNLNILYFDITTCEVATTELVNWYQYAVSVGMLLWILIEYIRLPRSQESTERKEKILFFVGIFSFVCLLVFTWNIAEALDLFELEQYGLFGMLAFIAILAYLVVRYHAFKVNLIAAQALIVALVITLAAELTFVTSTTNIVLVCVTLFLTAAIGTLLIRSVKREIQQREEIEQLATTLEEANQRQESLLHFIGHEVKGFLTKDMSAFAALAEGDLGALPDTMKPFVESALKQSRDGANSVIDILQASNQKKGTINYNKAPFDFKALVGEWATKLKGTAEAKGLTFNLSVDAVGESCTVNGDRGQLGDHVLRNLIENAINYTPSGSITLSLSKADGKVLLAVADTGVGINDEDKRRLFTEGGKGKDSLKVNVHSTGYGLFIAKNIVDAHGGTVRAESEGAGKGSRFIVELPAA